MFTFLSGAGLAARNLFIIPPVWGLFLRGELIRDGAYWGERACLKLARLPLVIHVISITPMTKKKSILS